MKVALVTQPWDEVYPRTGGHSSIPIIAYQIARRLTPSCDVVLYGIKARHQQSKQVDDLGIIYRRISVDAERWFDKFLRLYHRLSPFRSPARPYYSSYLYYLGYALKVGRDLKSRKCDIVHIFNFSQFAPIIHAVAPEVKIVLHMECEWLTQLDRRLIEKRLGHVDLVLGCSDFITDKIRSSYPQFVDRCCTVYNGVSLEDFSYPSKHKRDGDEKILFVGRVSPEKGVHILLDAFREIVPRHPRAQLNIVGPTSSVAYDFVISVSDDDHVTSLASFYSDGIIKRSHYTAHLQNQLPPPVWERVNMVGGVPHSQVVDHYRDADVFAFTSVWDEPFGIPMVEAMACGLPVVAAKGGAVPEIVENGKTGIWVERGNSTELADAILRLLEDDELRKSMGKEGRERASELFTWDLTAAKLLDYYQNLLDD